MSTRPGSGDAVTGSRLAVLTVSSRTEPDTGRPPATGTLSPDDANPPLRAHKESRRTPASYGIRSSICSGSSGFANTCGRPLATPFAPHLPWIWHGADR